MIRILIVDDELNSRELLRSMVEKYCSDAVVIGDVGDIEKAESLINLHRPNLILLDIEMPHGSGFKLLDRFPNPGFEVVFVTGFDQYALKAIKAEALDYLLKPVDIDELEEAIEKVRQRLLEKAVFQKNEEESKSIRHISLPTNLGREYVKIKDVIYFEADGSCTRIQLADRQMYSSKNLGEYEKIVSESGSEKHLFYRIHHGYLVNFQFIHRFNRQENHVELTTKKQLPLAQRRKSGFFNWMAENK